MNEDAIRKILHSGGGDLTNYGREVVSIGSYGPLMNRKALQAVAEKLDGIAAHVYLLKGDVEQAIKDLGREEQP